MEISPNVDPPVCRVMDYGKFRFEQRKKHSDQKRKQRKTELKEVKFRPGTETHDFDVKMRRVVAFLERGDKVKITIRFRGRELQYKDQGLELIERIVKALPEGHVIDQAAKMEGRQMIMLVSYHAK